MEHFQGIWAYFGDQLHPEPVELTFPEEFTSGEWTGFIVSATWKTNYQLILDNVVDPMHTPYLHESSFTMQDGDKSDEVVVTDTNIGIQVRRKLDPNSNVELMEFADTGTQWTRVGVPYPPGAGPGGILRIIATTTPIDAHTAQFNVWRMRKCSGWQRGMWRFMFNMKLEQFAWDVIEQDREIMEGYPNEPFKEHLYQHDLGLVRLRKILRNSAEQQVRELEAASTA